MARIRSVHPGLFTDADWVECPIPARLLVIGLWTYADDQGVFVWRPKEIKMAVFPGDSIEIEPLLIDLARNNLIRRYEIDGRSYGAIRNFRRWQRPQKPNALHPVSESIAVYVGLSRNSTLPVHDPSENDQRKSIQREEVGGRSKREEEVPVSNETLTQSASAAFLEFQNLYPKPDKLAACLKPWSEAIKTTPPGLIIAGLRAWLPEWQRRYGDEVRFIPNACDFLETCQWAKTPGDHKPTSASSGKRWPGPETIREAVVKARNEVYAITYLDPSEWDEAQSKIITKTSIAAERLRELIELAGYQIERRSAQKEAA
ncbi:hypothetical protein [Asticcacaulis taihuensis]|uniref:hypothetical protein n=1 Tax=Asticcacaulis taihuensis TaxID=260084 RepID=UPI0026EF858D|nr:hypothetical protein [Asticcacaulis taihuensis]